MWLTPAILLEITLKHKQCQGVVRLLSGKIEMRVRVKEKNKKK
jgi:hypothetical protein